MQRHLAIISQILPIIISLFIVSPLHSDSRMWTNKEGKEVNGELIATDQKSAILLVNNKKFTISLNELSAQDQAYIHNWAANKQNKSKNEITLEGQAFKTQTLIQLEHPISSKHRNTIPGKTVKVGLAFPANFDPELPCQIAVISAAPGQSSITEMKIYWRHAIAVNCVALAVDYSEEVKYESEEMRFALIQTGLKGLHKSVPKSRRWPIAFATRSNEGVALTTFVLAHFMSEKYPVSGLFCCSAIYQYFTSAVEKYPAIAYKLKELPICYSIDKSNAQGLNEQIEEFSGQLYQMGMMYQRIPMYVAGPPLHPPHFTNSLEWFRELAFSDTQKTAIEQAKQKHTDKGITNRQKTTTNTNEPPTESAAFGITIEGVPLRLGETITFESKLSDSLQRLAARQNNPTYKKAIVTTAFPKNFQLRKTYTLVVISATSMQGHASSGKHLKAYREAAETEDCVLIAADGPDGKPPADTDYFRYAMLAAGLDSFHQSIPGSKIWPVVMAGHSGGGKRSGQLAGRMLKENYNIIGVFMSGSNEDSISISLDRYHPNRRQFTQIPVFLSSGDNDPWVKDAKANVQSSMAANGFHNVRWEEFPSSRHRLNISHFTEAIRWFKEEQDK